MKVIMIAYFKKNVNENQDRKLEEVEYRQKSP